MTAAAPSPLGQSLTRSASSATSSLSSGAAARKIADNAVEAPRCPIAWGAWLRKYQHGSWNETVEPQSSIDPENSYPDHVSAITSDAAAVDSESDEAAASAAAPANGTSDSPSSPGVLSEVRNTSAKLSQPFKVANAHRYVKVDPESLMDSLDFYRQNGWLAAPPLPRRQYRRVVEALRRHGLTAAQDREALLIYIKHAKAVFRCEYASFMVESTDEAYMLILAQDGGDAMVQMVPRTVTLCSHAMLLPEDEVLVVNDTKKDWRFRTCPSTLAGTVTNARGKPMNFYASAPLFLSYNLYGVEGRVQVGRLCIMDPQPRPDFSEADADLLYSIGKMAGDALEKEYQSGKNAKAAEMQQRTSSLIRALEDVTLNAQLRHFNSSSNSTTESGDGFSRYSLRVIDRACKEMRECLGAVAVAAFDVSNFRFRRSATRSVSPRSSSTFSKATLPAWQSLTGSNDTSDPLTPPDESVSTPTRIDPDSPMISPRVSRKLSSNGAGTTLHAIDLREGSPPPSMLSYCGPENCRPTMSNDLDRLKSIFAIPLSRMASETEMNIRCKFYRRRTDIIVSSDEDDDNEAPSDKTQDPWADLLPLDTQIKSYAVCAGYNRAKARPNIIFFLMFSDEACFDQQERYFVESSMQIALSSLLRQKLSEVDFFQAEFLRHVQHNLRTPLHGALGAVEYLRAAISDEDDEGAIKIDLSADGVLAKLLESISLSGLTLNSYIDDLLSFQNLSGVKTNDTVPPRRVAVDLVKIVESVADEEWEFAQRIDLQARQLEADVGKVPDGPLYGMELIIKATPEMRDCEWLVDVKSLQDVVRRVVSNAIRYTKQGYVEISMRLAAPDALDDIDVELADDYAAIEIEVADTGVGMTKEFCSSQLTRPFSKGDSFRDGIGLGMTIVSSTLQKYGGKLSVASEVGLGTRVTMCMPLQRGRVQHDRNGSIPSASGSKFAVSKLAYHGLETRGLRRLANAMCEHFAWTGGIELTRDLGEADCIVLPERAAALLGEGGDPLLVQVKPTARFVTISSSHIVVEKGLEKLDGRPVMPLAMPHGPSAMRLVETFLSEQEPPMIRTANSLRTNSQHRVSVTELGIPAGLRRVSGHRKSDSVTLLPGADASDPSDAAAVESSKEPTSAKTILAPIDTSPAVLRQDEFRVLVVEDNPINMRLLTTLCKRLDIRYEEAQDGAEAVAKFISFRPSVVLLDISLPIQDGFEACTQMRAHNHPSFIVAVTALSSEEDKTRGIETCGMNAWMTKPVSPRRLKSDLEGWRTEFEAAKSIQSGVNGQA
ncbi:sensor histidine kinase/response regulator [Pseudozyma hubeiensis SY62]|uniref:histidine kinase n=1 Tax=Pseudozyma hubeiensis (strain SY62) TaxID=1305764 RepID=R9PAE7_PSEHS|nr:sensor histidine kinase/response regulator [Pseudozyma hubeiensis SY62]GAC98343.1 sensor histidine kinase/response regulator [Pseudozyma hubeiensis SY62]